MRMIQLVADAVVFVILTILYLIINTLAVILHWGAKKLAMGMVRLVPKKVEKLKNQETI
jgi:hypothetical protein